MVRIVNPPVAAAKVGILATDGERDQQWGGSRDETCRETHMAKDGMCRFASHALPENKLAERYGVFGAAFAGPWAGEPSGGESLLCRKYLSHHRGKRAVAL